MPAQRASAPLRTVATEWTRLGLTGFGGPPAHIALLRALVVDRKKWMDSKEFEDANAACGLLPGPASTQLAIFSAYRVAGARGAMVGGLGFVVPAVLAVIALSIVFLSGSPPVWIAGAGAGAGAAVPAVALKAGIDLVTPSFKHARESHGDILRWGFYVVAGAVAAVLVGQFLVLVLLACGAAELAARTLLHGNLSFSPGLVLVAAAVTVGGYDALAWVAFKVGALSYGGGFVIIPLMQESAVNTYHWMTDAEFLNAVALGQITPGPVVATVAAVGYAAYGIPGALLAATVAFTPSFSFILLGGSRFEQLRRNVHAKAFLDGAGPAAIGAILGAALVLTFALSEAWQFLILIAAAVALLAVRRGVVECLLVAGLVGVCVALAGGPTP
jgi:chromate transporter